MKKKYRLFLPLFYIIILLFTACDQSKIWELANTKNWESDPVFFIEILQTSPVAGEEYVSINSHIFIKFNDNIKTGSINSSTIHFNNSSELLFYNYYPLEKTIELIPATPLSSGTDYELIITTGIQNLVGETLKDNYTWTFKTSLNLEPEIEIFENFTLILSGGTYDFGSIVDTDIRNKTFTIYNTGSADLTIQSLLVSGPDAGSFILNTSGFSTIIPSGNYSSFTISLDPDGPGVKTAEIIITNNDISEGTFSYFITGTVFSTPQPEILVKQGLTIIPEVDGVFDFGTIEVGKQSQMIPISIHNTGSTDLIIDSIFKDGKDSYQFNLDTKGLQTTIPPLGSSNFYIQFSPITKGSKSVYISILNNDEDEATFRFRIKGRGF